jgi:hypothetical protein
MEPVCIVNTEELRKFARAHGERVPHRLHREWLERAVLRHIVTAHVDFQPSTPSRTEMATAHIARAAAKGEPMVRFSPSAKLMREVSLVVDWLADLRERDHRLAGKLRKIRFSDALEMSTRWHEQLRRNAERSQGRAIVADPVGAPAVLDEPSLGAGWSWVWLKSRKARQAEGDAMGHCVGDGAYEKIRPCEAILSLRDAEGIPHVTLQLDAAHILQAVTRGNGEVPARYRAAVERTSAMIGARLVVHNDPRFSVSDGCHRRNDLSAHIQGGVLHRDDGPAVSHSDSSTEWYREGRLHRDLGPAIEKWDGRKWWYRSGRPHREGGPAFVGLLGARQWFLDGQVHREDGPAAIWADGSRKWYRYGHLHREDGPAVEWANGTREWYREGRLHRVGGPAVERQNGSAEWYRDGVLHREDGPAVEWADGTRKWYIEGCLHREDGPAFEGASGGKWWYRKGRRLLPQEVHELQAGFERSVVASRPGRI